jgi:RNA polymerase sigma factor (sigma-70 family)
VNHRNFPAILRQLAGTGLPESDADLLNHFAVHRDEGAFASLVRRHGRLVWAVCQHLAGPDADDAFQATFLVLLRNATKANIANKLSAWLYGVAYRVCMKTRQSARRRTCREQVVAVMDRDSSAVPDSAWDRAFAAVHEEVVKLPEKLRVPFVLCTLEGKSVTEAAEQLGWKISTLSARLRRAKDSLLSRLDARGISVGSVTTLTCMTSMAPAEVLAKASGLVRCGVTVSASILQLSQGVVGMNGYQVKMLAVGVLLVIGFGIGSRSGLVGNADAQQPERSVKLSPDEKVKLLELQLAKAKQEAEEAKRIEEAVRRAREFEQSDDARGKPSTPVYTTTKWEYNFVLVSQIDAGKFVKLLQERESHGWDYSGQTTLFQNNKDVAMWVFRRPIANQPTPNVPGTRDAVPVRPVDPSTRPPYERKPEGVDDANTRSPNTPATTRPPEKPKEGRE